MWLYVKNAPAIILSTATSIIILVVIKISKKISNAGRARSHKFLSGGGHHTSREHDRCTGAQLAFSDAQCRVGHRAPEKSWVRPPGPIAGYESDAGYYAANVLGKKHDAAS